MKRHLLLLSLLACLSACQSTQTGVLAPGSNLRTVAGTWRFSHFGPPTVATLTDEGVPDPAKIAKSYLKGTTISLKETGEASMIFSGQARAFQAKVIENTDLYLRVGIDDQPAGDAFVYDKKTKLLMMPTKLEVNGSKGILPTYFRRR